MVVQGWIIVGAVMAMVSHDQNEAERQSVRLPPGVTPNHTGVGSPVFTGILLGIGIAGFIDESVFHQLLQWHTFYWATDQHGRMLSDGLFHVLSTLVLLWGTLRLWFGTAQRGGALLGGILMGAGGFNSYDGIVQHVILHLHLVNERVCPTPESGGNTVLTCRADIPYEVIWIIVGLLVFFTGLLLWRRTARNS